VGETGEGFALDAEAAPELAALEPATDPLESDLAAESGLFAFGQPDLAHAAFAEQPLEPVRTDPLGAAGASSATRSSSASGLPTLCA
jgi:hypothetical protein